MENTSYIIDENKYTVLTCHQNPKYLGQKYQSQQCRPRTDCSKDFANNIFHIAGEWIITKIGVGISPDI